MAKKKLTRAEWDRLDYQFKQTPDPSDGNAPSGEHYRLASILRDFGYNAMTRQQTVDIASELLSMGWKEEPMPKKKDGETTAWFGGKREN